MEWTIKGATICWRESVLDKGLQSGSVCLISTELWMRVLDELKKVLENEVRKHQSEHKLDIL